MVFENALQKTLYLQCISLRNLEAEMSPILVTGGSVIIRVPMGIFLLLFEIPCHGESIACNYQPSQGCNVCTCDSTCLSSPQPGDREAVLALAGRAP